MRFTLKCVSTTLKMVEFHFKMRQYHIENGSWVCVYMYNI